MAPYATSHHLVSFPPFLSDSFSVDVFVFVYSVIGIRLSFWHTLLRHGWILPAQASLSSAELSQENKLRQTILEAREKDAEEEFK